MFQSSLKPAPVGALDRSCDALCEGGQAGRDLLVPRESDSAVRVRVSVPGGPGPGGVRWEEALAELAAARGEATEAASLFGAAAAVRAAIGAFRNPDQQASYQHYSTIARAAAGAAEFARNYLQEARLPLP